MRNRPAIACCSVSLLLSGCLPDRDNPFDSSLSPAAQLDVVERTDCQFSDAANAWPDAPVAFRNACLALDARDTTDPQGTSLSSLSFTFERVSGPDDPEPVGAPLVVGSHGGAVFVLSPSDVAGFEIGAATWFRVRVSDPSGAVGSALGSVTMLNRRPEVATDPMKIIAAGGEGESRDIVLRARSSDPDGDPILGWRWTDAGGSIVSTSSSATVTIATAERHREVFLVESFDGIAWSDPVPASIRVSVDALWGAVVPAEGPTFIERFVRIGERHGVNTLYEGMTPHDISFAQTVAFQETDEGMRAVITAGSIYLVRWPDLAVLDVVPSGMIYEPIATHFDDAGRVWLMGSRFTDGSSDSVRDFRVFDTAGDVLTPVNSPFSTAPEPGELDADDTILAASDEEGVLWLTELHKAMVQALIPDATGTLVLGSSSSPPGSGFKGLARRPGHPGVWAIQGQTAASPEPGEPALLHLRLVGGAVQRTEYPLEAADAQGLTWLDERRFWTWIAGRGLCIVDVEALQGGSLESAIEAAHPTSIAFLSPVVAPLDGETWWSTPLASHIAHLPAGGELRVESGNAFLLDVDPDGLFWFRIPQNPTNTLQRGEAPWVGSQIAFADANAVTASSDREGGLWVTMLEPKSLVRFAPDGSIADVISVFDLDGEDASLPLVIGSGFDGEGSLLIAGIHDAEEPPGLFRIDLRSRIPFSDVPPPLRFVTPANGFPGQEVFAPSPDVGDHVFWTRAPFFIGGALLHTDAQGTTTEVLEFGFQEDARAALLASGELCFGFELAPSTVELHRVDTLGVATLTTALSFGSPALLAGVAASGDDRCWVGTVDMGASADEWRFSLRAFDASGEAVAAYADPGYGEGRVLDLKMRSDGTFWLLREANGTRSLETLAFPAAGGDAVRTPHGATAIRSFAGR